MEQKLARNCWRWERTKKYQITLEERVFHLRLGPWRHSTYLAIPHFLNSSLSRGVTEIELASHMACMLLDFTGDDWSIATGSEEWIRCRVPSAGERFRAQGTTYLLTGRNVRSRETSRAAEPFGWAAERGVEREFICLRKLRKGIGKKKEGKENKSARSQRPDVITIGR